MTTDSKLATKFISSPNHRAGRLYPITKITIHHAAMVAPASQIGNCFVSSERKASATYCVGNDGSIVQCVKESDAPWTSNSYENDNRAITIEVSNSKRGGQWPVGEAAYNALINLLVDICQRNPGIGHLNYTGDTTGNLTMHKWFASTQCPGPYLAAKFPEIAAQVNARLDGASTPIDDDKKEDKPTEEIKVVYDLSATGLTEELAKKVAAEISEAGFEAKLTTREIKVEKPSEDKPDEGKTETTETVNPDGLHYITGKSVVDAKRLQTYIKSVRPDIEQSVLDMIPYYISEGEAEGIAGDVAFAQSCIETGNFKFNPATCAVTIDQNNFAMMGVTGTYVKGESFATPQLGIRAQIQHLKAYANKEALKQECVDPRFSLVLRGCAPYVEWLGMKENPQGRGWASAKNYGYNILRVLNNIREIKEETPKEDKTLVELKVGDVVVMQGNAPVYGENREFKSWVYKKNLYVRAIDGDKITISIFKSGAITGCVHRKYLNKV